jgi:hypothetical protein
MMKTEPHARTIQASPDTQPPRSLQELAPTVCRIETDAGHPVRLGSVGFVLHGGGSYCVRVVAPFAEQPQGVALVCPPEFIERDTPQTETDEVGQHTWLLPFRVKGQGMKRLFDQAFVTAGDLQVAFTFGDRGRSAPKVTLPIVLAPGWSVFVGIALALLVAVLERVLNAVVFSEDTPVQGVQRVVAPFLAWTIETVLIISVVVLTIFFVLRAVRWVQLYRRSGELKARFRERYPAL